MRKRVCVLLLALLPILSLCACGASLEQAAAVEEAEAAPSEEPTAALSPLEQLIADAEAGDTEAMCKLGEMYRDGDGVEANLEEARSWYGKAGEAGHAYAYLWLADSYYFPNYGTQDYDKAFEYYSKAAELGSPDAMGNLGVMYGSGRGVEQDYEKAAQWYEKAVDAGCGWALRNLAFLYMYTVHDDEKAEKYLTMAAETGDSDMMAKLGDFYSDFEETGRRDYVRAVEWYTKSAEADPPSAYGTFQLGQSYNYGYGVQTDFKKAFELFNRAVEIWKAQDSTDEIYAYTVRQIADMYASGRGVTKDLEQAEVYYQWAEELNPG